MSSVENLDMYLRNTQALSEVRPAHICFANVARGKLFEGRDGRIDAGSEVEGQDDGVDGGVGASLTKMARGAARRC